MKKFYLIILALIIPIALIYFIDNAPSESEEVNKPINNNNNDNLPVKRAQERITKKPFGIKVSPNNSPVTPERFSGYHTGVDYEIFPGEENSEIEVYAICNGKLIMAEKKSGYGGLLVQECNLKNQSFTIIYGHIQLSSVEQKIGDYLTKGEKLALLGAAFSPDTDNNRKHLHLGIHSGAVIDIRGYVQNQSELENWLDYANAQPLYFNAEN
jgi:murein DD-endopeptidase MepM/ murein hydrolase activator NlpD